MTKDRLANVRTHVGHAPPKRRVLRLVMLIFTGFSMSLAGCGTTPTSSPASVPTAVTTPTLESTPAGTSTAFVTATAGTSTPYATPTTGSSTPYVTPTHPTLPGTTTFVPTATLPPPTATNSPTATPYGGISEASVTIDTVTLTIRTPFLPRTAFAVASQGDAYQAATSEGRNPYRYLTVLAVPFGTNPPAESDPNNPLPASQAGGAEAYRSKLREYKVEAGGNPQPGPSATLFGQQVASDVSLLQANLIYSEPKPTLQVEWVVEAGPRLWIIRIVKQLPDGTTDLSGEQSFLQSLERLTISSNNLDNPSTLRPAQGTEPGTPKGSTPPVPSPTSTPNKRKVSGMTSDAGDPQEPDTLFPPPWWNGDVCDDTHYYQTGWRHIHSFQLGGSYMHLDACGPRPIDPANPGYDVQVSFGAGGLSGQSINQFEWECTEYTKRYLRLRFNINPYDANGNKMVDNYGITKATSNPNGPDLEVVTNGGQPPAPQPGDVLSYNAGTYGHTSLVKLAYVNSTGNGSIYVAEENNSDNGISQLPVQNWSVYSPLNVTNWLVGNQHFQPAAERNQDGRLEVLVRGQDGALWHKWQTSPNCCWSGWYSEGGVIRGNPAVVRQQNGALEVFARGQDGYGYMYKKYQLCPGCNWSGWERWVSPVRFQGSPVAIVNDSSYNAYVFGWGADNQIWYSWRNYSSSSWSDWIAIPSISTTNAAVAMDDRDPNNHRVTVFHRGTDNVPYYSQQSCPSCGFGGWTSLGGTLDGPPVVGTTSDGRMVAFALGTDTSGGLYRNSQQPDGSWGGWVWLGGQISRGPVVAKNQNGALEVYVIQGGSSTYQNQLYRKTQLDNWYSWTLIGGDWHVGLPSVARNQDGRLELFGRGDNRAIYNMWQNSANDMNWTCCSNLGGQWP